MIDALFHTRDLTFSEIILLKSVFKHTLVYDDLEIGQNLLQVDGPNNSITPFGIPYMSIDGWTTNYATAPIDDQWVFIHEFAHVWQYLTGQNKIVSAIKVWKVMDKYEHAYDYDLATHKNLMGYNFEAQAAIVADYFFVAKLKQSPKHNTGTKTAAKDYVPFMTHLWNTPAPMTLWRRGIKRVGS